MPELEFEAELQLQRLLFADLDDKPRALFQRVHQLAGGCALLSFLDEHPHELLTAEDLAFHAHEARAPVEQSLRALIELGLVRPVTAAGTTFFGLNTDPAARRQVHDLFDWQRRWHTRLARIENLVNGHAR
jgi:hypothetical protein